jgi:hypothetical protein
MSGIIQTGHQSQRSLGKQKRRKERGKVEEEKSARKVKEQPAATAIGLTVINSERVRAITSGEVGLHLK